MQSIRSVCPAQDMQRLPFERMTLACNLNLLWITVEVGSVS